MVNIGREFFDAGNEIDTVVASGGQRIRSVDPSIVDWTPSAHEAVTSAYTTSWRSSTQSQGQ
ncbi:MAG: hypothetical protein R2706_10530 [Acidimicrobiales bacterium]